MLNTSLNKTYLWWSVSSL